jgi:hypothetical protein
VANHGFSGHRERGLDEVKEQNLVIRSQSKSKRTTTKAISKSGKAYSFLIRARAICLHLERNSRPIYVERGGSCVEVGGKSEVASIFLTKSLGPEVGGQPLSRKATASQVGQRAIGALRFSRQFDSFDTLFARADKGKKNGNLAGTG